SAVTFDDRQRVRWGPCPEAPMERRPGGLATVEWPSGGTPMVATSRPETGAPIGWVRAGAVADLEARGITVVSGERHGIAVVAQREDGKLRVHAVDNRCPHMGVPLSRGTVCDGILTCHWHHARFDLASGGTFDPFADDVAVHDVAVVDGEVWVDPQPRPVADRAARWLERLDDGLQQDISLVIVKAVLGLLAEGDRHAARALERGGLFGVRHRAAGWGPGLTILTAMGNVLPLLPDDERAI